MDKRCNDLDSAVLKSDVLYSPTCRIRSKSSPQTSCTNVALFLSILLWTLCLSASISAHPPFAFRVLQSENRALFSPPCRHKLHLGFALRDSDQYILFKSLASALTRHFLVFRWRSRTQTAKVCQRLSILLTVLHSVAEVGVQMTFEKAPEINREAPTFFLGAGALCQI